MLGRIYLLGVKEASIGPYRPSRSPVARIVIGFSTIFERQLLLSVIVAPVRLSWLRFQRVELAVPSSATGLQTVAMIRDRKTFPPW